MSVYGKAILESTQVLNEGFITNFIKKRILKNKNSKKKKSNIKKDLKYFFFTSEEEFKIGNKLPSNLISYYDQHLDDRCSDKEISLIRYLDEYYAGKNKFYYTKDNKPNMNKIIFIYKINKDYTVEELTDSGKLSEVLNSVMHTTIESVNENNAIYKKKAYDYCISRLKTLSKECKLSGKHLEIGEDSYYDKEWYKVEMKYFIYEEFSNESGRISILSGDLWEMNPNARTDQELNEQIEDEVFGMIDTIEQELKSKFNNKFIIDYSGDWDAYQFDLVEKKK